VQLREVASQLGYPPHRTRTYVNHLNFIRAHNTNLLLLCTTNKESDHVGAELIYYISATDKFIISAWMHYKAWRVITIAFASVDLFMPFLFKKIIVQFYQIILQVCIAQSEQEPALYYSGDCSI
jgi:hypothetical protein